MDPPGATGSGAFAVATVNVGARGQIKVAADTAGVTLPVNINVCETNPNTATCLAPPGPSVTTQIAANATPTFSVFISGNGIVPSDPANNRVIVSFADADGVIRGSTSTALQTNPQ